MATSNNNNKTVRGALPCGNPKRYTSAEVVQMHRDEKSPSTATTSEVQNESDQYMRTLLKRQIHTDVTLKQQFSQHRDFIATSSHAPVVTKLQGLHNVSDHARLEEFDSTIEYLRSCGLTMKEIAFKMKQEMSHKTEASGSVGFGADPSSDELIIKEIDRKLKEKELALKKPDEFNGGLELSRHALLLEKAILERQNKEGSVPEFLFREKKVLSSYHPDDPINHIPEILSDIDPKSSREPRRERRRKRKLNQKLLRQQKYLGVESDPKSRQEFMESVGILPDSKSHSNSNEDIISNSDEDQSDSKDVLIKNKSDMNLPDEDKCFLDMNSETDGKAIKENSDDNDDDVHQTLERGKETQPKKKKKSVQKCSNSFTMEDFSSRDDVTLLSEDEIQSHRLSLQDILSIDTFKHYEQGVPNRTVFVKNLPRNVKHTDLISLFGRFQTANAPQIVFRLLNGRMKGQAFIEFPDTNTAKEAIASLNGYKLSGKPVILSFGKKQGGGDTLSEKLELKPN